MATTTILDRGTLNAPGTATLTKLDTDTHAVLLVTPDATLAGHFGCHHHANQLIGGLFHTSAGWAITAYTDRDHMFNNDGPVYYLPAAKSRAAAVRALLRWWWLVSRADKDTYQALNPFDLSVADQRALVR